MMTTAQAASEPLPVDELPVDGGDADITDVNFDEELQAITIGSRVHHEKLGNSKAFTKEQAERAANEFGADSDFVNARKMLIDAKAEVWRNVVSIRGRVNAYWKSVTVPHPEVGVRLIRRDQVEAFNAQMEVFHGELMNAVDSLAEAYDDLKEDSKVRLADLYNEGDFVDDVRAEFNLTWDFPSLDPPEYLKKLSPKLYEAECARVKSQFSEAVLLQEQMFVAEFSKFVDSMANMLSPAAGGKKKAFRAGTADNLKEFFDRFQDLSVGSNAELNKLVEKAKSAMDGVDYTDLKNSGALKGKMKEAMDEVAEALKPLVIEKPTRKVLLADEVE